MSRSGKLLCKSVNYGRALWIAVLVLVVCTQMHAFGVAKTLKHDRHHEIEKLEDAWRDALLKGNATVLATLLGDDYTGISAMGTLLTKEQTLANLRSGKLHFELMDISDRKIRFYGPTAIVTSLAEIKATTADGVINGRFRYTRVYVRDAQGKWKVVSFEASRIHDSNSHGFAERHNAQ